MTALVHSPLPAWAARLQYHAMAIGIASVLVLVLGWTGLAPWLRSLGSDLPSMKAATAAGLTALSLACLASLRPEPLMVRLAAAIGMAVALWMGIQLILGVGRPETGVLSLAPSEATMTSLMLGGLAFALMPYSPRVAAPVLFTLAVGAVGAALFRAFDLLLLGGEILNEGPFDSMAVHTAILIAWLFVASVLLHPRLQIRDVLLRASLRGRILRYGLLVIIALPFASYALAWAMSHFSNWNDNALFAATASLSVAGGSIMVWWFSQLVENLQARTRAHVVELTRANEALERYASSTAHDLKAPIRHIRVYSELSIEALRMGNSEKAVAYAESNIESADQLLTSVESLLAHARTAFSELSVEEHRVSEMLRAATMLLHADLLEANAKITIGEDAVVTCDGHLIESVFQNLLSNSLAYGGEGSLEIRVSAERARDEWKIVFEDNGSGFAPDFIPKAFDYLSRAEPGGSGIGLTTCRTILTRHGGDIVIDPEFKGGARLVLTLPVKPSPHEVTSYDKPLT